MQTRVVEAVRYEDFALAIDTAETVLASVKKFFPSFGIHALTSAEFSAAKNLAKKCFETTMPTEQQKGMADTVGAYLHAERMARVKLAVYLADRARLYANRLRKCTDRAVPEFITAQGQLRRLEVIARSPVENIERAAELHDSLEQLIPDLWRLKKAKKGRIMERRRQRKYSVRAERFQ